MPSLMDAEYRATRTKLIWTRTKLHYSDCTAAEWFALAEQASDTLSVTPFYDPAHRMLQSSLNVYLELAAIAEAEAAGPSDA